MNHVAAATALACLVSFVPFSFVHPDSAGFRVKLMPPCEVDRPHGRGTDFMGDSVALEIHSSGPFTINGSDLNGQPWLETLKWVFSRRYGKALLIWVEPDVEMETVLTALDRLNQGGFIKTAILLTPKQAMDFRNDSCVMKEPS